MGLICGLYVCVCVPIIQMSGPHQGGTLWWTWSDARIECALFKRFLYPFRVTVREICVDVSMKWHWLCRSICRLILLLLLMVVSLHLVMIDYKTIHWTRETNSPTVAFIVITVVVVVVDDSNCYLLLCVLYSAQSNCMCMH